MIKINIRKKLMLVLFMLIICFFFSCQKRDQVFFYIRNEGKNKEYLTLTKKDQKKECNFHLIRHKLLPDFSTSEYSYENVIELCQSKDTMVYMNMVFPINCKIGTCLEFKKWAYPDIYETCLNSIVLDTQINNVAIKTCLIYSVKNRDEYQPDDFPVTVFFDDEREIIAKLYVTNNNGKIISNQELVKISN